MILFLDTSALVKLYIEEEHRGLVIAAIDEAEMAVTCTIAYAESRAALARILREGNLSAARHQRAVAELDADWLTFTHLGVTNQLAYRAGELAQQHALRGFDAVHLACALRFSQIYDDVKILAFDQRLIVAAGNTSLRIYGNSPTTSYSTDR